MTHKNYEIPMYSFMGTQLYHVLSMTAFILYG